MVKTNEVNINGEVYIKKSEVKNNENSWLTKNKEGKTLCLVRTYDAGVFVGWIDYENATGFNIEVYDCFNVWKWEGAFTLLALATTGTTKPADCRFSINTSVLKLNRWIELIPIHQEALTTFEKVKRG